MALKKGQSQVENPSALLMAAEDAWVAANAAVRALEDARLADYLATGEVMEKGPAQVEAEALVEARLWSWKLAQVWDLVGDPVRMERRRQAGFTAPLLFCPVP